MITCPVLILCSLSAAGYEAKLAFALIWDRHPSVPVSGVGKSKPLRCLDAVGTGAIGDLKNSRSENIWDHSSS